MKEVVEQNENVYVSSKKMNKENTKIIEQCISIADKSRLPLACKTNQVQAQKTADKTRSCTKQHSTTARDIPAISQSSARGQQQAQPIFSIFSEIDSENTSISASSSTHGPSKPSAAVVTAGTQTDHCADPAAGDAITAADLCDDAPPGESYWRRLAESRRQALQETLDENKQLHAQLTRLQQEKHLLQQALQHAEDIVESVKEWTAEHERKQGHEHEQH